MDRSPGAGNVCALLSEKWNVCHAKLSASHLWKHPTWWVLVGSGTAETVYSSFNLDHLWDFCSPRFKFNQALKSARTSSGGQRQGRTDSADLGDVKKELCRTEGRRECSVLHHSEREEVWRQPGLFLQSNQACKLGKRLLVRDTKENQLVTLDWLQRSCMQMGGKFREHQPSRRGLMADNYGDLMQRAQAFSNSAWADVSCSSNSDRMCLTLLKINFRWIPTLLSHLPIQYLAKHETAVTISAPHVNSHLV